MPRPLPPYAEAVINLYHLGASHADIEIALGLTRAQAADVLARARARGDVRAKLPAPRRPFVRSKHGDALVIEFTNGGVGLISECDLGVVLQHAWYEHASSGGSYIAASSKPGLMRLHRVLLHASADEVVDHVNGNGMDNRRCNLRLATAAQNVWNSRSKSRVSMLKGVWFHKHSGMWTGTIKHVNGWRQSIGYHATAEDAARAHDKLARGLRGDFARLNFPEEAA